MDIERLREYIELAHHLNFTAAAHACHLSQPALSNHIASLEREAGTLLVERSTKSGTRLTPAGQCFLDMALQIVATYDEKMPELRKVQKEVQGTLRIRSPRQEYSHPLLEYIYEFQNEYPNIEVILVPWVEEDGYADVASGEVDCALAGMPLRSEALRPEDDRDVQLVPFAYSEQYISVDRSHPLARMDDLRAEALDGAFITIPANQKRMSWISLIEEVSAEAGIQLKVREKYCNSLDDFIMNKLDADDVFLVGSRLREIPALCLRHERVTRPFVPPIYARHAIAYRDSPGNLALQAFVAFLRAKEPANPCP